MGNRRRVSVSLKKNLIFGATLFTAPAMSAAAQMHHVEAPQHVTRAIGVYEWTGDLTKPTAARFVPVSLFINGEYEDAGLYLARPVPFALQPGYVYALEHAGEPAGLLDLDFAHRVVTGKALADDNTLGAWYGFGRFTPTKEPKLAPLHPSSHLSKLDASAGPNTPAGTKLPAPEPDSDRPHMNRRDTSTTAGTTGSGQGGGAGSQTAPASTTDSTPSTTDSSAGKTTSTNSSDDDVDRPTLRRRDPAQDAARRKEANTKSKTASVTAAGPALGDDPDRPILGHNTADNASTPELTGLPADMHQAIAVSDASHDDSHPFARAWESAGERSEVMAALATLARARLTDYLAKNQLVASSAPLPSPGTAVVSTGPITSSAPAAPPASAEEADAGSPPKLQRGVPQQYRAETAPAAPKANTAPSISAAASSTPPPSSGSTAPTGKAGNQAASRRTSAAHGAQGHTARSAGTAAGRATVLSLGGEELVGFTLSYGGLPTFVYTAAASVKPAGNSAQSTGAVTANKPAAAYVTLVAQRLPSGELQVAMSAVTDDAHLDRGPRLHLIDAVDPDDSHRASLLFELRGASSRQFALYRLTSARAEQTFTTASIE